MKKLITLHYPDGSSRQVSVEVDTLQVQALPGQRDIWGGEVTARARISRPKQHGLFDRED